MSTTTRRQRKPQAEDGIVASTAGSTIQGWLLILLVFVSGACSLAVELSASRLLAPYFGTSLFVWSNLIGLILLYLTIGYYVGGRLADRYPRPGVLYALTIIASFLIGLIPFISRPILLWSQSSFATYSIGVFYGSLVAVILLFAIPMILLGCVSPFAIRLRMEQLGKSGRTAGQLYALSTAGSILGTFLPVLWLIPSIGTYRTFFTFAVCLLLVSILALTVTRLSTVGPRRRGIDKTFLSILLLIPMVLSILAIQGPIKPADGSNGGGVLLAERESAYNYIQVVQVGAERQLILNEGVGIHSIYNPDQVLTQGPWDYFMMAPFFNNPPYIWQQVQKVGIIGLGAGTAVREFTAGYGPIPIDGVEIDPTIVSLGRQYFDMNEKNLNVIVQDGRYYLQTTQKKYDVIAIDAYQQPYVPFQLTTKEFFQTVRDHLTPTGTTVINAGRTNNDFRLVEALAQTMHSVFPNVYIIDTQRFDNSLIIATNAHTALSNFAANTNYLTSPLLEQVAQAAIATGNIREEHKSTVYFTDDRAPVEQLIDEIIFDAVTSGNTK
jgi:spermidine synthase